MSRAYIYTLDLCIQTVIMMIPVRKFRLLLVSSNSNSNSDSNSDSILNSIKYLCFSNDINQIINNNHQ